ncbi:MAG TPA: methyltransferase domain-containing protein [Pyrinomonadaceae bacterium]
MQQVREDFDRIAVLSEHEEAAHGPDLDHLLSYVPQRCEHILEVGCGFGIFTRLMAARAERVTAIDLSPQMIRVARERSNDYRNLEFVLTDFLQADLPEEEFDCIVTIATLHHLPLDEALLKLKSLVKPGGVLIIQDLIGYDGLLDKAFDIFRLPLSVVSRFWRSGRLRPSREVRQAWVEHGKHDTYLTAREARRMRDEHFPGAYLRRHLLWRYTLVWRKDLSGPAT